MTVPSFKEDHISQLPALKLLINMGWKYLSPEQALEARGGRTSNVLLETILKDQLQIINTIEYKGKEFPFSDANVNNAILAIRDLPVQDGFIAANKAFYELITLGRSFEQSILGDKKSFSFHYIDWKHPENNTYHVSEEFSVLRSGSSEHYRPDIVLFINGIPVVVIECKSPKIKDPIDKSIEQHLRNQQEDGIRALYQYSNLAMGLATHEAKYATTATQKEFWSFWKELFKTKAEETAWLDKLQALKNQPLPTNERTTLFQERYKNVWTFFQNLEKEEQAVTEQDKLLFSICQPERLLDLFFNFTLYDDGIKKVTRYQQYFAVHNTLDKVVKTDSEGLRKGGVIWHTQGSGKSLTMVMLAQLIATHPQIKNPKIILVTDRIDLDDQITETFKKCQIPVENAQTGKHLVELLSGTGDTVITTLIHKFEAAVNQAKEGFDSPDIFVLVDEGHRSQYGTFNIKMQKVFPKGCFIAFTGTPLMKKEKSTANRFGGLIDVYSITDAVEDGAVVPLLYEGRHNLIEVNEKPLDNYFDRISEPLTPYGKAALKRKFSSTNQLNKAEEIIYARAWDISDHYEQNVQDILFGSLKAKGQLVAPNKTTAIRYREFIRQIGKITCEVLISPPDVRENYEDAFEESDDLILKFWKAMMDKYGSPENYEKSLISSFKKQDQPEIIIVVDKLLTGFDAPNNYVLYLTRQLKEHTLLQAIARVNRLAPGKEHGLIIDYYGNLENLDMALETYSGADNYDAADLEGTLTNISEEIKRLPQAHSEVWDIFKEVKNKYDEPAYEELLQDEAIRHIFYEKVSAFSRLLKLALSSFEFISKTPEQQINKYKQDAKFFLGLRIAVKRRYFDDLEYKEYEPQVQKLIDKHITTEGEILRITEMVNIFDKEERDREVEKITSKAAKADHIASRTIKAINVKINEDPVYYKKLSRLIRDTIEDYHQHRISEADYLNKAREYEDRFHNGRQDNVPENLTGNDTGIAIYNLVNEIFKGNLKRSEGSQNIAALMAEGIDEVIKSIVFENGKPIIDWVNKSDIEGRIKIDIDDYLFDLKTQQGIELPFDLIDELVEEGIKVAKLKYV
ncbi:type I restriction endonuclease subunit R [Flagellimonas pelagia]|uniref:Type I restriction enzyme endonuclease subunit n=1 Tax=Flagellimonas pelagia TaxID=2306998 RepID=A0A3A1NG31_9FLAO|nr:type I restriction endonuclease subunit R [Allomuricauda maritima]RIV42470.1 type I restriction endonuclease subunit R [Allomuricauda maritima]TXJ91499.1 type I restriction endonuclease subunit R [Allomuricauda maritima]